MERAELRTECRRTVLNTLRSLLTRAVSVPAALLLVAASATTPIVTQAQSAPLTKASLRLDWTWLVYHVAFAYAKDQGYYANEGIDLDIGEGQGSGSTVTLVGNKNDTFGFADTGTTLVAASKGVPVQVAEVIQRRTGFGTACFKDVTFNGPKDLEGKSVLLIPQESTAQIWPAYLKLNGVDASKIEVRNADFSNKVKLFAQRQADCMAGVVGEDTLQAQLLNSNIADPIAWADNGIQLFGHGIVVNSDTLNNDPDLVRGFLKATTRGWQEVCADTASATQYFEQKFPEQNASDADRQYTEQSLPFECGKNQPGANDAGAAYGPTTDAQWQSMIDVLHTYGGLDNAQVPATYYTNAFVPTP